MNVKELIILCQSRMPTCIMFFLLYAIINYFETFLKLVAEFILCIKLKISTITNTKKNSFIDVKKMIFLQRKSTF